MASYDFDFSQVTISVGYPSFSATLRGLGSVELTLPADWARNVGESGSATNARVLDRSTVIKIKSDYGSPVNATMTAIRAATFVAGIGIVVTIKDSSGGTTIPASLITVVQCKIMKFPDYTLAATGGPGELEWELMGNQGLVAMAGLPAPASA